MFNTRLMAAGGILVCLAVIFQSIPCLFGEILIAATIVSGFPVFIAARLSRPLGFLVYLAAGLLVSLICVHEGIFFFITNGLVGLTLGLPGKNMKSSCITAAAGAVPTAAVLFLFNYVLGMNFFDINAIKAPAVQIVALLCFLFVYCLAYYRIALHLMKFVENSIHFPGR